MSKTPTIEDLLPSMFKVLRFMKFQIWPEETESVKDHWATVLDDLLFIGVCIKRFWSGLRSVLTLGRSYSTGNTKQHRWPRKIALRSIIESMDQDTTFETFKGWIFYLLTHDIVDKEAGENNKMKPYQVVGVFENPQQTYDDSNITLVEESNHNILPLDSPLPPGLKIWQG
jgi:hypothetical protein